MNETKTILQAVDDAHLRPFAAQLAEWLIADLNQSAEPVPDFTESRAKALLRATKAVDAPTLDDFMRHIEGATAVRLALHDLLTETGLANNEQLPITNYQLPTPSPQPPVPWLALSIAAYAWKSGYPLHQLDPASPPEAYSPAGQVVKRAAHWMRQQIQRSATERDKLARKLAYREDAPPSLDNLQPDQPIAPVPPHFRPPIPVNYPEVVRVKPDETAAETATRSPRLTITTDDLAPERPSPRRMPPIRVTPQRARPAPSPANFNQAVRRKFGRNRERMVTTKLRVIVQEYPDGPGLYGLQVKVTCKGIRSFVAGTTGRDGRFLCQLPVRQQSGLTYDVDIAWPADLGGKTERKSITLNADRTEFTLPFFQKQRP